MQKTLRLRPHWASDSDYHDFLKFGVLVNRSKTGFKYLLVGEYKNSDFAIFSVVLDIFYDINKAVDVSEFLTDLLELENVGTAPKNIGDVLLYKYSGLFIFEVCSSYGFDLPDGVANE